jgi:NhaA family Na+:H+ antiporter
MVGGGIVYVLVNLDGGELRGWAVPIATDIAFALGALGLVGRRAPSELRAFLLTLAVVDDLGTIAVIGLFYTDSISLAWFATAAGCTLVVVVLRQVGVRYIVPYVVLAGILWFAVLESGIHATIAGVVLGFLTPAFAMHAHDTTGEVLAERLDELSRAPDSSDSEDAAWEVSRLARESVSPLTRMETQLHPWSAYVILPVFALANAGVPVSAERLADALTSQVGLGIALGLIVGAPLVGIGLAWAAVRATPARLPGGLDWSAIAGVAPLKGIGFTVAIFISVLAFDDDATREQAKLAILAASFIAALIGVSALHARHRLLQRAGSVRRPPH